MIHEAIKMGANTIVGMRIIGVQIISYAQQTGVVLNTKDSNAWGGIGYAVYMKE